MEANTTAPGDVMLHFHAETALRNEIEQFIADLDELVDAVRKRLGKDKVAIYGHSWGSALGVLYAAREPFADSMHPSWCDVQRQPGVHRLG